MHSLHNTDLSNAEVFEAARPGGTARAVERAMRGGPVPRVSVCVPTYNSADSIERCVTSVLEQSFGDFECLVVDNASTDNTLEVLRRFDDPRLRVVRNDTNIGMTGNHNKLIALARGELIQFVHSDDWLLKPCLRTLETAFDSPRVGLAFARRRVDTFDAEWRAKYATLHGPLEPMESIIDGQRILRRYVDAGADGNWIGEPTSVMVRTRLLRDIGGFRADMRQFDDIDTWLRVLARSDAGWFDTELSVRWQHEGTDTVANLHSDAAWLDRAWLVAGLARNPHVATSTRLRALPLWFKELLVAVREIWRAPAATRGARSAQLLRHLRSTVMHGPDLH